MFKGIFRVLGVILERYAEIETCSRLTIEKMPSSYFYVRPFIVFKRRWGQISPPPQWFTSCKRAQCNQRNERLAINDYFENASANCPKEHLFLGIPPPITKKLSL